MKTRAESKKFAKENERLLRMKNKPTSRKLATEDLPKFKRGSKWRVANSSSRVKEAIERNQRDRR